MDVHEGLQSWARQHLSPAFLAGAGLWVATCSREQKAAGDSCFPIVGLCSTAVSISLQRTCEAAESFLIAFHGGEDEAQQNL